MWTGNLLSIQYKYITLKVISNVLGFNLSTSHEITHLYSSKFYEIESIIISILGMSNWGMEMLSFLTKANR